MHSLAYVVLVLSSELFNLGDDIVQDHTLVFTLDFSFAIVRTRLLNFTLLLGVGLAHSLDI